MIFWRGKCLSRCQKVSNFDMFKGMSDVEWYGQQLKEIGVEYVGFCCGNTGSYTRTLAMQFGRRPPAAE